MGNLFSSDLGKAAIALAACWGLYHFVKVPAVRAGAISVGAVIVAKQLPFVSDLV